MLSYNFFSRVENIGVKIERRIKLAENSKGVLSKAAAYLAVKGVIYQRTQCMFSEGFKFGCFRSLESPLFQQYNVLLKKCG